MDFGALLGSIYSFGLALIVLGVLITLHEFGHFIVCRINGIRVEKFSIGFGREIWALEGKHTRYAISLIPLGGYVKPAGEDRRSLAGKTPQKGDYLAASVNRRMAVVLAGPCMNWLLAWALWVGILMMGQPIVTATIGSFVPGFPAEASGLEVGDQIVKVNHEPVDDWLDLTSKIVSYGTENLLLTVVREGRSYEFTILPRAVNDTVMRGKKHSRIGIKPDMDAVIIEKTSFFPALLKSGILVVEYTKLTFKTLAGLIARRVSLKAVSGPLGIIKMAGDASAYGLVHVLQLAAMLSVSLAVFNVLPIPILDGGHFLFLTIEKLKGSPVSVKVEERSMQVCFFLLIGLLVVVTGNDIANMGFFDRIKALLPGMSS